MRTDFWTWRPVWAPEDGAGGGADTVAAAGGADTVASGGADTVAGGGADTVAGGDGGGSAARWWEGRGLTDAQRQVLTAKGWTVDDPMEALPKIVDAYAQAERRLGKPADQLIERPKEGQDVAEWLRANGDAFGVPKDPEGYQVDRPEDWPKDAPWDADLEAEARKIAHEEGLHGRAVNRFVGLYAQKVQGMLGAAEAELAQAQTAMQTELQKDWGPQYAARVALAQQAASVVAEKAGLDQTALQNLAATLKPKVGDAGTLRLFAAIGEMMGEDSVAALNAGGTSLGDTPAQARAKLAELRATGGAYFEAVQKQDRAALERLKPEIERLTRLAAG